MAKDTLQNRTNKLVPSAYYEMFALRIKGYDMKDIADQTGYSHQHVRNIFSKGGVLYDLWRDWVQNRKADKVEEAMDLMFEHLPDVVKANIAHAMTGTPGAPFARKLIFDGTLGDLVKRAESKPVGSDHATVADLIKSTYQEDETESEQPSQIDQAEMAGESAQLPKG